MDDWPNRRILMNPFSVCRSDRRRSFPNEQQPRPSERPEKWHADQKRHRIEHRNSQNRQYVPIDAVENSDQILGLCRMGENGFDLVVIEMVNGRKHSSYTLLFHAVHRSHQLNFR